MSYTNEEIFKKSKKQYHHKIGDQYKKLIKFKSTANDLPCRRKPQRARMMNKVQTTLLWQMPINQSNIKLMLAPKQRDIKLKSKQCQSEINACSK